MSSEPLNFTFPIPTNILVTAYGEVQRYPCSKVTKYEVKNGYLLLSNETGVIAVFNADQWISVSSKD